MHDFTPFYDRHVIWIPDFFRQLITYHPCLAEPVKIKMANGKLRRSVFAADSKRGTRHSLRAARPAHQPARKRRLAAPQITYQLNDFTAAQTRTDSLSELFGLLGTGGTYLQCRGGTHTPHILPRERPRRQAHTDASALSYQYPQRLQQYSPHYPAKVW